MKIPPNFRPLVFLVVLGLASSSAASDFLAGQERLPAIGGTTYYVSARGNDAHPGTSPRRAWKSIARVNQQDLEPGDAVLFEGGTTFAGNLVLDAADAGQPRAPVTIGSYGRGRARIAAGAGLGIAITNAGGFVVRDLIVRGDWNATTQTGNETDGVLALNTAPGGQRRHYLRFDNLEVSGFKQTGINLLAITPDESRSGFENVRITDCEVHDNGDIGIGSGGPFQYDSGYSHHRVYVARNRVYNTRGLADASSHTGNGIVLSDVDGAVIEHCVASNNGELNDAGGGPYGIWAWDSNNVTIQFNEAYANKSMTADGGGFDLDGGVTNSVMQYNYSHDNYGPGYGIFQFPGARPFGGNIIRYNVSWNDGQGGVSGILLWDGNGDMGDVNVVQNTIYGSGPAFTAYSGAYLGTARFANNLFVSTGGTLVVAYDSWNLLLQGNDYWTGAAPFRIEWVGVEAFSLAAFRSDLGQEMIGAEPVGLNVDPGFRNVAGGPAGLRLRATSLAINAGLDLRARFGIEVGRRDFFGERVPQGGALDLGASEAK